MTTESHELTVAGVRVTVVRKGIKNLHLGVYPPDGRVRVAAPLAVSDAAVRAAVAGKLGWIGRQRAAFREQPRQSAREMVSGESHFYLGRRYRLVLVEGDQPRRVVLRQRGVIELYAHPHDDATRRREELDRWYRERLWDLIPPLLEKWQRKVGAVAAEVRIKRMKTKWGSCSADARRLWLNLELVKKSPECIEYLVVHELIHLRFRHHDDRFYAFMDRCLPRWRETRRTLNAAPLGHATWVY